MAVNLTYNFNNPVQPSNFNNCYNFIKGSLPSKTKVFSVAVLGVFMHDNAAQLSSFLEGCTTNGIIPTAQKCLYLAPEKALPYLKLAVKTASRLVSKVHSLNGGDPIATGMAIMITALVSLLMIVCVFKGHKVPKKAEDLGKMTRTAREYFNKNGVGDAWKSLDIDGEVDMIRGWVNNKSDKQLPKGYKVSKAAQLKLHNNHKNLFDVLVARNGKSSFPNVSVLVG